jgi:hypothetical protein
MSHNLYSLISGSQEASVLTMFILYNLDSFIDDQVKPANSHLVAFQHTLNVDYGQDIINKSAFQPTVEISISSHRGAAVDLDEPRLQISINHKVIPVELE